MTVPYQIKKDIMNYILHEKNNNKIVEITDQNLIIQNEFDFLDLIANLPSNKIIIYKNNLTDGFFDLKTGIAGHILQKVSTYNCYLGIIGDFSNIAGKSLKDFIYESNKTKQILFKEKVDEIIEIFSKSS